MMAAAGGVAGFGSRWRTVCGLRVHALESAGGAGPAVVLLPGLVTASRSMVPLARALTDRGMRVWIVDPPGFGYSDKPRRSLPVGEQAAVVAEWLTAAGGRPAMVLGNSFGSQVAAAVAADHPGTVARLVLLSPTVAPAGRQRLSWLAALSGPALSGPALPGPAWRGRWRARLLARLHEILGDEPSLRLLNLVEYGFASLPRATGTLRSAVLAPIEQVLPRVDVPVLVVRADQDRLSSLAWAERLASLPPDGRVARLPGLGHDAFHRAPATVAGTVAPFLAPDAGPDLHSGLGQVRQPRAPAHPSADDEGLNGRRLFADPCLPVYLAVLPSWPNAAAS